MIIGCKLSEQRKKRTGIEDDYLDMTVVEETDSAWFGRRAVPCIVTNRLNHRLGLRMAELNSRVLKDTEESLDSKDCQSVAGRNFSCVSSLVNFLDLKQAPDESQTYGN